MEEISDSRVYCLENPWSADSPYKSTNPRQNVEPPRDIRISNVDDQPREIFVRIAEGGRTLLRKCYDIDRNETRKKIFAIQKKGEYGIHAVSESLEEEGTIQIDTEYGPAEIVVESDSIQIGQGVV